MIEYDKMSFHVEDVEVIRQYAISRGWTFVYAMHRIATVLKKVMSENRELSFDDFSMPLEFHSSLDSAHTAGTYRQRNLFSTDRLSFNKIAK